MSSPSENPAEEPHKRESLKSVMARKRKEMQSSPEPGPSTPIVDPYASSTASNYITRGQTGVVYDPEVLKHKCEWDDHHPERPERLNSIMEKVIEKDLLLNCTTIPNPLRADLYEKILFVHTKQHYNKLRDMCQSGSTRVLEDIASTYDSVYFNRHTFDAASRAVSSTLNLVLAVAKRDIQNGMAIVRPPGHHAMTSEYNGYCFFNNVAIAAETCIREKHCKKVLIFDIDVHHGQGIQRMFYERKDVLYFSIHRYEHGTFWPYLFESNYNFIGKGEGLGYNINVPLNSTGLTDDDYLAIVFSILLPVAYEFNPDIVIVSAGYDAVIGCPEYNPDLVIVCGGYDACLGDDKGQMNLTPGLYAHIIALLSGVARGQIAVVLEGGYFLPTLSEAAALTLKSLLGAPCPLLNPIRNIHPSVIETICNVRRTLHNKWNCFKVCEIVQNSDEHNFQIMFYGVPERAPFPTRKCYPINSDAEKAYFKLVSNALQEKYQSPLKNPVVYVYDEQMLLHAPPIGEVERPERPERLPAVMKVFKEYGIDKRMERRLIATRDFSVYSPHAENYFYKVNHKMIQSRDVYANEYTHQSVQTAVSGVLNVIDSVMSGSAGSGVAVVRPPGHHAEYDKPMGFCFINNIAVAANYLNIRYDLKRVLIVDFDIHHGNGTQNLFYTSKHVMYISIHKDENGKFFPPNSARNFTHDGYGPGKGYNVNIPFNKDKMGDTEYLAVFHNIILPIAYSYSPQFVLVSAGFDAGINDTLGDYRVNPETFGHMVLMLKPLAEGRVVLVLEGGYNLTTTGYGMGICAKALLGDPIIMPRDLYKSFSDEAVKTIRNVINHFKRYYNILQINKKLSFTPILVKKVDRFTEESHRQQLTLPIDEKRFQDSEYMEKQLLILNEYVDN